MFSKINSLGLWGLQGAAVTVEADTFSGLPAFDIVGLPDAAVSESRERVRLAIKNSGFVFPVSRITVNLAPADIKKTGAVYDLPIFIAILCASGQIAPPPADCAFLGELSLDGTLRPVSGVLPMACEAEKLGITKLYVPAENAQEAAIARGVQVYAAANCDEVVRHLSGKLDVAPTLPPEFTPAGAVFGADFSDVKGQAEARMAMEIAAAGMHNILLIGPAGTGKSMLARRLPSIMPAMQLDECIEVTKIYSVSGQLGTDGPYVTQRPFRAPHHTVSAAGLTGGGSIPKPGEISKAHKGVLFLDELAEFPRTTLDVLRQPVEEGKVTISRSAASVTYPCEVLFAAAMNPCPCGNFGNPKKKCSCPPHKIQSYIGRISGPLLDRIDLHVEVAAVEYESLANSAPAESSAEIRKRVEAARLIQQQRYAGTPVQCNSRIPPSMMSSVCTMDNEARELLRKAFDNLALSARAHDKVLKVARTIADLDASEIIQKRHIARAVSYRALDKKYWNA